MPTRPLHAAALPTNGTAYYNTNGNTTGAGYDGPGECLKHVFGHGQRLYPSTGTEHLQYWRRINNSEFITPNNKAQGFKEGAWLFAPPQCEAAGGDRRGGDSRGDVDGDVDGSRGASSPAAASLTHRGFEAPPSRRPAGTSAGGISAGTTAGTGGSCKLIVLPGGCDAYNDDPPDGGDTDAYARYGASQPPLLSVPSKAGDAFARFGQRLCSPSPPNAFTRYGMANGFVLLKPCTGGSIDLGTYPENHENRRGMIDVYGQLTELYATQLGGQMEPIGKMIRRLLSKVG